MKKYSLLALGLFACTCLAAPYEDLQQACDQNNVEACWKLAEATQVNDKLVAYKAYGKACELQNAEACYRAAFVLNWNFGENHISPTTARKFLRQACKLKYQPACQQLVDIWKWGE